MTTGLVLNVGLAYLETFRRSPDAGPFSIEYGGFVDVARSNQAVRVLDPTFRPHRLVLNYLVSTYAANRSSQRSGLNPVNKLRALVLLTLPRHYQSQL